MEIQAPHLAALIERLFTAAGCQASEAETIARRLVQANLVGHDSHGVIRAPIYIRWLQQEMVRANQSPKVVLDSGPLGLLDGQLGFGQVMGEHAMRMAIEKAETCGVAVVGLRNSGHVGRVGDWPEMAAAAGLISFCLVNTTGLGMLTAPFGGIDRRLSANPFAAGIPTADGNPILLDISCSAVAEGKLKVALNKGVDVPDDCIIDHDGKPTNSPAVFYGDPPGAILSFGGHKGYGLGMVVELLAGALTGGGCTQPGRSRLEQGMLSIVVDPARFQPVDTFTAEVNRFVEWVKGSRTLTPDGEVLTPGEPERRTRQQRSAEGIPLDEKTWEQLSHSFQEWGVAVD
ncbi:MAG: malate/lactate/ureidoglycolate dehydrogenase [Planctomycetaceae bacterium]|nr:malate/lactate/ureidoglycolate dehydrogenase [Planctomycetaceae bacterium]